MMARDVMTTEVHTVTAHTTLRQVAQLLVEKGISGVPVVDSGGAPVGMVTERDLIAQNSNGEREAKREWWLAQLATGEPLSPQFLAWLDSGQRCAGDVMSAPVVTVTETTELPAIARLFLDYQIKRVPVIRDGKMIGIVSRVDLVRRMAQAPAAPPPPRRPGFLAEAVSSLEDHFTRPDPAAAKPTAKPAPPPEPPVSAGIFAGLVDAFGHRKAHEHDEDHRRAAERRQALVKQMIDQHIEDDTWRDILHRARAAAEAGQKEMLLLRFPCDLCSDGGRAINSALPDWPATLRGEAAEIYLHWEHELQPKGFHLIAQVLDFPGGIPGDIGLTLVWGGGLE